LILLDHLEVDEMHVDRMWEEDCVDDEPILNGTDHWIFALSLMEVSSAVDCEDRVHPNKGPHSFHCNFRIRN
jgi:hypothetical protein